MQCLGNNCSVCVSYVQDMVIYVILFLFALSVHGIVFNMNSKKEFRPSQLEEPTQDISASQSMSQGWSNMYYYQTSTAYGTVACLVGECVSSDQCQSMYGIVVGACIAPMYPMGVCCKVEKSCAGLTQRNVAIFNSPHFPDTNKKSVNCAFTMITQATTCAVRIDFLESRLTPALDNSCYEDVIMVLVNPHKKENYNTPFCGYLQGFSTVVQIDGVSEVKIIATTQDEQALWSIRLTQINCDSAKLPEENACGFRNGSPSNSRQLFEQEQLMLPLYVNGSDISEILKKQIQNELPSKKQRPGSWKRINSKQNISNGFIEGNTLRILNGTEAQHHEFPWLAILLLDNVLHCGASLITHRWLITAGHCVALSSSEIAAITRLLVLLGAHNLFQQEPRKVARTVSQIVRHPSSQSANYDIALLQLTTPVRYSFAIRPLCLPSTSDLSYSSDDPIIAGWGERGNNLLSDVLQVATIPLVTNADCKAAWRKNGVTITDAMICARVSPTGSCNGDSGGPLVAHDADDIYYIIGIISFGAQTCGDSRLPEVFTRVTSYLRWISFVLANVDVQGTPKMRKKDVQSPKTAEEAVEIREKVVQE